MKNPLCLWYNIRSKINSKEYVFMTHILKNQLLTAEISEKGAEVISVKSNDGYEYIWQGDEKYWKGQNPTMFPICGRLFGGRYTFGGKEYEMNIHGFARHATFTVEEATDDYLRLCLKDSEASLAQYPFPFALTVEYRLCGQTLTGNITVENRGKDILPFALGLHPGFNAPLDKGSFEDCYIEFTEPCSPDKIGMSDTCFLTGKDEAFYLEDGCRLSLDHSLFDNDAIFLSRVSNEVTLRSRASEKYVRFTFDGFPYLGLWHAPRTDAPYICIEPWCGLPSYDGEIDDLSKKRDMFRLVAGGKKQMKYTFNFGL